MRSYRQQHATWLSGKVDFIFSNCQRVKTLSFSSNCYSNVTQIVTIWQDFSSELTPASYTTLSSLLQELLFSCVTAGGEKRCLTFQDSLDPEANLQVVGGQMSGFRNQRLEIRRVTKQQCTQLVKPHSVIQCVMPRAWERMCELELQ